MLASDVKDHHGGKGASGLLLSADSLMNSWFALSSSIREHVNTNVSFGTGVEPFIQQACTITALGLKSTRPAPLKPPLLLLSVMVAKWAALKARKNSTLVMWLMCALIKYSISRPYILFRTLKHL